VLCLIKWPGVIKPGTIVNDICAHEDFIPTFAAANGDTDLAERLTKGTTLNGKTFKVHLDGYNLLPFLKGDVKESPRKDFFYWSDDGDLMALRYRQWKIAFLEQNTQISPEAPVGVWTGQFTKLRVPKLYNLRSDPFERGPESIEYAPRATHRVFVQVPAQALVAKYLDSFKDFPPRAKPASFAVSDVMEKPTTPNPSQD
jgi:arylsulfatase A-like enzyme